MQVHQDSDAKEKPSKTSDITFAFLPFYHTKMLKLNSHLSTFGIYCTLDTTIRLLKNDSLQHKKRKIKSWLLSSV